ncbi:MAG: hypothetical protein WCH04_17860 [Gammaproteobacteria bacterium]
MKQRIRCLGIAVFTASILAGCGIIIPVPLLPSGDIYATENDIEDLVDNGASKAEVIEKLGDPIIYRKTSMSYAAYREPIGLGLLIFIVANGDTLSGFPTFRGENKCFELLLDFDQDNHLTGYQEIPWQYDFKDLRVIDTRPGRVIDKTPLGTDEPASSYAYIIEMSDKSQIHAESEYSRFNIGECINVLHRKLDVRLAPCAWEQQSTCSEAGNKAYLNEIETRLPGSAWRLNKDICTYCPKADIRQADAQTYIGDLYYLGAYGLEKNLIQAYVWYSLAAKNGNSYATNQLEKVVIDLSPEQLVEAQHRLEQWEPGQCKRDLMQAISEKDK